MISPGQQTFIIKAREAAATSNIKSVQFYTGNGIAAGKRDEMAMAQYYIDVKEQAEFRVFVLASLDNPVDSQNNLLEVVTTSNPKNEIKTSTQFELNEHATKWYTSKQQITLLPGRHVVHINFTGKRMQYVEQLIFSSNKNFAPSGILLKADTIKPILPPAWAFGILYGGYTNQQKTKDVIDSLIAGGFPIDAYWIDSWFWDFETKGKGPKGYMNFIEDKAAFPDTKQMWTYMQERKIKSGVWMWNCIQREGNEAVFDSFYTKKYLHKPEINTDGWHNKPRLTINADVDFGNEKATAYWKNYLQPHFRNGLDFLKLDRSSDIDYCKTAFEASQQLGKETNGRGFILNHLMQSDDPRFKLYPTKWSGDAKIAWAMPEYPDYRIPAIGALKENIMMVADPKRSTYEIPFLTHDGGGYDFFGSQDFSNELYTRWAQFSCFAPITTFFSTGNNPSRNHPYWFNETVQKNVRKYMQLRLQLFPYIYSYAHKVRNGERFISGDGVHEQQYFFGNELLVAPVYEKGLIQQKVYLPKGKWIDWESLTTVEGCKEIVVDAPLEKLPLLVKEGAIIPMRNYARAVALGTNDTLVIKVFPTTDNSRGEFYLYEDDGTSNDYINGKVAVTKMETVGFFSSEKRFFIAPVEGNYEGMNKNRFYTVRLFSKEKPTAVSLNGKKVKYSWDGSFISVSFQSIKTRGYKLSVSTLVKK
jgi:alpha-glucosidase (family GH31 glycosyl hydrolase)